MDGFGCVTTPTPVGPISDDAEGSDSSLDPYGKVRAVISKHDNSEVSFSI